MKSVSILNRTRKTTIACDATVLDAVASLEPYPRSLRLLDSGEALLIYPARSANTTGASSPIDILFISPIMNVSATYPAVIPGTILSPRLRSDGQYAIIELPLGTIAATGTVTNDNIGFGAPHPVHLDYTSRPVTNTEDYHA